MTDLDRHSQAEAHGATSQVLYQIDSVFKALSGPCHNVHVDSRRLKKRAARARNDYDVTAMQARALVGSRFGCTFLAHQVPAPIKRLPQPSPLAPVLGVSGSPTSTQSPNQGYCASRLTENGQRRACGDESALGSGKFETLQRPNDGHLRAGRVVRTCCAD